MKYVALARISLLLSLLFCLMTGLQISPAADARPNVLLILVDDQSPLDLKLYNPDSILETPNIDRLAAEGVVVDAAYHMGSWSGAVCTPSRHMIMSGRTVWHIPNNKLVTRVENGKPLIPPDLADHTLGAVFNKAGYKTMRTCKRGNSYAAANARFSVVHDATKRGGTAETGSAWHGEQVLNFLKAHAQSKESAPFMIYYGFSHPHDVRDGTPELLARYGATNHADKNSLPNLNPRQPTLPPNYLPKHPFDNSHLGVRDEVSVKGVWGNRDEATIRNELGREFACSENIDIQIGRVLKQLEAMGELDNTYIIYTADHGMAIGRHGLQGKQNLYEHTWRVPFVIKGPDIPAGKRVVGNMYLLDVLATLCDLTGVKTPVTNEGKSLRPVLEGRQNILRETLYGVYCGGNKPGIRCVKQGDWKLLKYQTSDGQTKKTQLFNLKENPLELIAEHHDPAVIRLSGVTPTAEQTDLADDPRYATKRREMEALLLAEMRRLHDPYRFWDQPDDSLEPPKTQQKPPKKKRSKKQKNPTS